MSDRLDQSPSQNGGNIVAWWLPKRGVATADELIEIAVEDSCSGLEQQVSATGRPAHRLTLVEAFVHDLVDRGLHEAGGDALTGAEAFTVVHDVACCW
ncbi:MAG: hypothetical protein QOG73_4970 [Acetobacteraceae bacterium]|nr:hypothetical protein [Acetobacteraceae bacterium]